MLITNPTHLAVALRYQRERDGGAAAASPRARASCAAEMRALARRHRVPIDREPPLARELFRAVAARPADARSGCIRRWRACWRWAYALREPRRRSVRA